MGGGFLSRSRSLTEALGGGGKESVAGIPVVFAVPVPVPVAEAELDVGGLLLALSIGLTGPCVNGIGDNRLAPVGVLLPASDPPLALALTGLFKISIRLLLLSLSKLELGGTPGLNGLFRFPPPIPIPIPPPDPEPVESTGEGPADPGPTFGLTLTTCCLPPTITVGLPLPLPDAAKLINDSATPSS